MHRMDDNMPFLLRYENVAWYDSGKVRILDRRAFPEVHFVECSTYREVRQAVADMVTQSTGPYAAVAMGMVLAPMESRPRALTPLSLLCTARTARTAPFRGL